MSARAGGAVWVVGSLNEDLVLLVPQPLTEGATVLAEGTHQSAGGKGLNQACAASRAGADVHLVGTVGVDDAGVRLLAAASAEGVDTAGVTMTDRLPTGRAFVVVAPGGSSSIVVDAGANRETEGGLDRLAAGDIVVVQLEIPLTAAARALRAAVAANASSVLSASPVVPGARELVGLCDVCVVNADEVTALLDPEVPRDVESAALRLCEEGCGAVVVTLGAEGALVVDADGTRTIAASAVSHVADTTGAGDAFTGALAAALARGEGIDSAAAHGVRAGSEVIVGFGAQPNRHPPRPAEGHRRTRPGRRRLFRRR